MYIDVGSIEKVGALCETWEAHAQVKHITEGGIQQGKTCLYNHFEEAKAWFSYVGVQVNNSVGQQSQLKFFIWGACPNVPLQVCAWPEFSPTWFYVHDNINDLLWY